MPLPILRMEQTLFQLGINVIKPRQELHQPSAELNMQQIPTRLEIYIEKPVLLLDATQARADLGYKSVTQSNAEYAARGRQAALEAIAKITEEGLALRSIETGGQGKKIKQIAKQNFNKPMLPSRMAFLPKFGSLKIDWIPGDLEIEWHEGGVVMNPVIYKPIHNYIPGKAEGYVLQKNSLRMWVDHMFEKRL